MTATLTSLTMDLSSAAALLGIGRTSAYQLVREDRFPVPALRIGHTYRVPTVPLLDLLRIGGHPTDPIGATRLGEAVASAAAGRCQPIVSDYLKAWLKGSRGIADGTRRSYEAHIRIYLIPHLGALHLDQIEPWHITSIWDAIDERNDYIEQLRSSLDPQVPGRCAWPTDHRAGHHAPSPSHPASRTQLGDLDLATVQPSHTP